MIKAVILLLCLTAVVFAIVIIVNWFNARKELRDMEYDPKTGVFYNPSHMERTEKKGVISFKSKND